MGDGKVHNIEVTLTTQKCYKSKEGPICPPARDQKEIIKSDADNKWEAWLDYLIGSYKLYHTKYSKEWKISGVRFSDDAKVAIEKKKDIPTSKPVDKTLPLKASKKSDCDIVLGGIMCW